MIKIHRLDQDSGKGQSVCHLANRKAVAHLRSPRGAEAFVVYSEVRNFAVMQVCATLLRSRLDKWRRLNRDIVLMSHGTQDDVAGLPPGQWSVCMVGAGESVLPPK